MGEADLFGADDETLFAFFTQAGPHRASYIFLQMFFELCANY